MMKITVEEALNIMLEGDELANGLKVCADILDKIVENVHETYALANNGIYIKSDSRLFIAGDLPYNKLDETLRDGARPLFAMSKSQTNILTVICKVPEEAWCRYIRYKLDYYDVKRVLVTGSAGKTTVVNVIDSVLHQFGKTYKNMDLHNGLYGVCNGSKEIDENLKYFVQETTGTGYVGFIRHTSKAIGPDVCIITNIDTAHLDAFHSKEGAFERKIQCVKDLNKDGILIVNIDDELLRSKTYECKTITMSLSDESADYYCKNINAKGGHITCVVHTPTRDFDVDVNLYGKHNLYAIMSAIICADKFGINDDEIIKKGLREFKTTGVRQNVSIEYKNNTVITDCYSTCNMSVKVMMDMLMEIDVPKNAKRVALLGHISDLGKFCDENHKKMAKIIANYDVDLFITCGGKSYYFYDECIKAGKKAYHFNDVQELKVFLRNNINENDAILVKGIHRSYPLVNIVKDAFSNNDIVVSEYKGNYADNNKFHVSSNNMIVKNITTGEFIIGKNENVRCTPYDIAGLLVVVTLCNMPNIDLNKRLLISNDVVDCMKFIKNDDIETHRVFRVSGLRIGGRYPIGVLLKLMLEDSAIDAAYTILKDIDNNEFCVNLNKMLIDAGCTNTYCSNCFTSDLSENFTTANDVMRIIEYMLSNEKFKKIIDLDISDYKLSKHAKSLIIKYNENDEFTLFDEQAVFVKKMHAKQNAGCVSLFKIKGEYVASVILGGRVVFCYPDPEIETKRIMNTYKQCEKVKNFENNINTIDSKCNLQNVYNFIFCKSNKQDFKYVAFGVTDNYDQIVLNISDDKNIKISAIDRLKYKDIVVEYTDYLLDVDVSYNMNMNGKYCVIDNQSIVSVDNIDCDLYKVFIQNGDKYELYGQSKTPIINCGDVCVKNAIVVAYKKINNLYKPYAIMTEKLTHVTNMSFTNEPMLSVIIPVHNVGHKLAKTVGSILLASNADTEIILAENGSSDSTLNIITQMSNEWQNVKVIETTCDVNWTGPMNTDFARHEATILAKGEYVSYVDSDDYVSYNYYIKLMNIVKTKTNIDIVTTDIDKFTLSGCEMFISAKSLDNDIEYFPAYEELVNQRIRQSTYAYSMCGKIIKRKIALKSFTRMSNFYEDTRFTIVNTSYAENAAHCRLVKYYYNTCYIQNKEMTNSVSYGKYHQMYLAEAIILLANDILDQCNQKYIDEVIYCTISMIRMKYKKFLKCADAGSVNDKIAIDILNNGIIELNKRYGVVNNRYVKKVNNKLEHNMVTSALLAGVKERPKIKKFADMN